MEDLAGARLASEMHNDIAFRLAIEHFGWSPHGSSWHKDVLVHSGSMGRRRVAGLVDAEMASTSRHTGPYRLVRRRATAATPDARTEREQLSERFHHLGWCCGSR